MKSKNGKFELKKERTGVGFFDLDREYVLYLDGYPILRGEAARSFFEVVKNNV